MNEVKDYKLDDRTFYVNRCVFREACKKYGVKEAYSNKEDILGFTHYFDNAELYLVVNRNTEINFTECEDYFKHFLIPLYGNTFCSHEFSRKCNFNLYIVYSDEDFYFTNIKNNKDLFSIKLN